MIGCARCDVAWARWRADLPADIDEAAARRDWENLLDTHIRHQRHLAGLS